MVTKIPSLLLQISLYFNGLYLLLFYLVEIVLLFVKSLSFPYPARNLWPELILLIFLSILDATRIFLGMKGNLTGRKLPLVISIAFLFPLLVGYLYYVLWQTYV
jgi:transmembrane protein 216